MLKYPVIIAQGVRFSTKKIIKIPLKIVIWCFVCGVEGWRGGGTACCMALNREEGEFNVSGVQSYPYIYQIIKSTLSHITIAHTPLYFLLCHNSFTGMLSLPKTRQLRCRPGIWIIWIAHFMNLTLIIIYKIITIQ